MLRVNKAGDTCGRAKARTKGVEEPAINLASVSPSWLDTSCKAYAVALAGAVGPAARRSCLHAVAVHVAFGYLRWPKLVVFMQGCIAARCGGSNS